MGTTTRHSEATPRLFQEIRPPIGGRSRFRRGRSVTAQQAQQLFLCLLFDTVPDGLVQILFRRQFGIQFFAQLFAQPLLGLFFNRIDFGLKRAFQIRANFRITPAARIATGMDSADAPSPRCRLG